MNIYIRNFSAMCHQFDDQPGQQNTLKIGKYQKANQKIIKNCISAKCQLLKKNSDNDYKYLLTGTTPSACRYNVESGKNINHIKKLKQKLKLATSTGRELTPKYYIKHKNVTFEFQKCFCYMLNRNFLNFNR